MIRNKSGEYDSGYNDVLKVLCNISNIKQMESFLEEILTPAERRDLALRWNLMQKLEAGIPQRQIASELGISLCKITRGAKILRQQESITKKYLNSGEINGPQNSSG